MSGKKHILVISQYFYPETFRINDMCAEWVKRGYKVTVITGIPNYPMGKTFEGYGFTKRRRELWNGVEIIRIPLIARGSSKVGMVANYLSFVISGYFSAMFSKLKPDYVFTCEVSPMTQVLVGCWYAKKHKVPHYVYIQDLWPENVIAVTGINNPAIIKPINKMADYIYSRADEIFTTSPSFVQAICNREKKVSAAKVHYWPQYAEEFYKPVEKKEIAEISNDASFKIAFTGNIGVAQGLDILPKTAVLLKGENVKFIMIGDGRYLEKFNDDISRLKIQDKFVMIARQPSERIPEILAACDVAFLSFQDKALWKMTIPAKLQSYMACGKPIVAAAEGETERIIKEADCGICSKIGDAEALAEAIRKIMYADTKKLGANGRRYFEEHFDKQKLMDEIEPYFER